MVLNWSMRGACGIDLRGYLGSRASRNVFGLWKETDVRILRAEWEWAPWRAAFLAALALLSFADGPTYQSPFQQQQKKKPTFGCSLALGAFGGYHYYYSRESGYDLSSAPESKLAKKKKKTKAKTN